RADGFTAFAPSMPGRGSAPEDAALPYVDNVHMASREIAGQALSESAVSAWWLGRTIADIAADPLRWLSLVARKSLLYIVPIEIPGNYDPYYYRSISPVLTALVHRSPVALPFSLVLVLLPAALVSGLPTRRDRLLLVWTLLLALGTIAFFVTSRLRLPAVPFMLLLSGSIIRGWRVRQALAAGCGALLALALTAGFRGLPERSGVNMPFYDGLAAASEGSIPEARALFLEALERGSTRQDVNLNRVEAMYNLGVLAAREGDLGTARQWWLSAIEACPGYEPALDGLGRLDSLD
ncbi:tetratricopeptide repeat protein, partial [Candidatus Fermentibacterales bacterium]|nr:tetratricopeptide repeat protein [Candidatus Fermentibacterales bacterium]